MTENPGGEGAMPLLRVLGFALLVTVAIALIAPPVTVATAVAGTVAPPPTRVTLGTLV